ncbi:MAG: BamA/TamA family outer membrane protein [Chitinophagaceae bacterium]|nr:BamA/TamA family outer membrane protein [Chitinophagaceae bacterium]
MVLALFVSYHNNAQGQIVPADSLKADSLRIMRGDVAPNAENLDIQYDVGDLVQDIIHPNKRPDSLRKRSGITIIPNVAANPTIGFQIGIKAVAGLKLGKDPRTLMSVAATSASITTKGIIYFYLNHNIFTNGNKWNIQGSIVSAKMVTPDFGIGIGHAAGQTAEDEILTNPDRKKYVLNSLFFDFREKVYKEVSPGIFIGVGLAFEIRGRIEDKKTASDILTPYKIYSSRYGFDLESYRSNGLLFSFQYTTRDNQNRAYNGIFADAGFRANQDWLGSSKNALQFTTDFRKYHSLSTHNPEHVIAFWNWGAYLINGALPYLELPGTGRDASFRSGRGYTVTYFKGTKYNYSEVEYRFPLTENKFLSGVTFFNLQTSNNDLGTKLFKQWQPGGGFGLRVLFNKATRTNLCLDYAFGKYGAKGFFLGLNEAF